MLFHIVVHDGRVLPPGLVRLSAAILPPGAPRVLDVLGVPGQGVEAGHVLHERQEVALAPHHVAQQVPAAQTGRLHRLFHEVHRTRDTSRDGSNSTLDVSSEN